MSDDDPYDSEDWRSFVEHVRKDTLRGIVGSRAVISLAPAGEPDVKLAVETGLAILLDKPIIAIGTDGAPIPPGLRRVAHAIVEVDDMDTEAGRAELAAQLAAILRGLG
jgi:hypothetical protein